MGWRDFQNTAPVDLTDKIDFIPPDKRFNQLNPFNPPRVDSDKSSLVAPDTDPATATEPVNQQVMDAVKGGQASENFNSDGAGLNGNSVPNVFEYRLTDSPSWLVFLAPGVDFNNARRILEAQFGEDRLVEVRPKHGEARK